MQLTLTILVAVAVAGGEAINPYHPFAQHGAAFAHNLVGYGGYGGFGLAKKGAKQEQRLQLTCSASFEEGGYGRACSVCDGKYGKVVEGLAINIMDRDNKQAGYGAGFHHTPFDGGFVNLFSGGPHGLKATLEVFSMTGGTVSIIITEKAFTGEGCIADNFGLGESPRGKFDALHGGGFGNSFALGGYAAGGYGGHAGHAGYGAGGYGLGHGLGAVGIAPHSFGFAHPHAIIAKGRGYGSREEKIKGDGVIAVENLQPGVVRVVRLDKLDGFKDLKNLAGKGVIVCTETEVGYGGKAKCTGQILSCCSLAYDHKDRSLEKVGY